MNRDFTLPTHPAGDLTSQAALMTKPHQGQPRKSGHGGTKEGTPSYKNNTQGEQILASPGTTGGKRRRSSSRVPQPTKNNPPRKGTWVGQDTGSHGNPQTGTCKHRTGHEPAKRPAEIWHNSREPESPSDQGQGATTQDPSKANEGHGKLHLRTKKGKDIRMSRTPGELPQEPTQLQEVTPTKRTPNKGTGRQRISQTKLSGKGTPGKATSRKRTPKKKRQRRPTAQGHLVR